MGATMEMMISNQSRKEKFEYRILRLHKTNGEPLIRREIEAYQPEIVAVAGGDGTVNLLAKITSHSDLPLLIIPIGSANGMARELGIGSRIDYAFNLLKTGIKRKIDLLKINNIICVHLADVGLNARVVKRFEKDLRRGMITYAKYLLSEIFLIKHYRFHIRIEEKEIVRKAVSLTFANASKYGTGMVINPASKLDDGKFELVIIKPFPRVKLLSIAWKLLRGTLISSEYVEVISCRQAVVSSSKKTTLQVDGEIIGRMREIKIEILPQALTVLVPPLPA